MTTAQRYDQIKGRLTVTIGYNLHVFAYPVMVALNERSAFKILEVGISAWGPQHIWVRGRLNDGKKTDIEIKPGNLYFEEYVTELYNRVMSDPAFKIHKISIE